MKRILSICFSAFVLVSCQKEVSLEPGGGGGGNGGGGGGTGGGGAYYLKAKVNGTSKNFSSVPSFKIYDFGGFPSINIFGGISTSTMEGIALQINFNTTAPPTAGTYSETDPATNYAVGGVYNPNSQTYVYGVPGLVATSDLPLEIKITSLDSREAKGTFKGAFYKMDLSNPTPNSEHVTITEGEFFLPVTH